MTATGHPTVRVRYPHWHLQWMRRWVGPNFPYPPTRHLRLDVGIVALVKALWALRIPTLWSCQGGGGYRDGSYRARVDLGPGYAEAVVRLAASHGIHVPATGNAIFPDPADLPALAAVLARCDQIRRQPSPAAVLQARIRTGDYAGSGR